MVEGTELLEEGAHRGLVANVERTAVDGSGDRGPGPTYDPLTDQDRAALFAARVATAGGTRGTPGDIAETVLYLMKSGYSTGTVVDIDGGHLVE